MLWNPIKIIVLRKKIFLIEQCYAHNKNIATAKIEKLS